MGEVGLQEIRSWENNTLPKIFESCLLKSDECAALDGRTRASE